LIKNLTVFVSIFFFGISSANSELLNLQNVSEFPILSMEQDDAQGNLIGFIGGKGLSNSEGKTQNFLGKQKEKFYKRKYNYYLFPNPNSWKKASYPYRASEQNTSRIKALVDFLKKRNSLPSYLVGFSRGSVDVSSYAMRYPDTIKGVVIISGVYANSSRKASDYSTDLMVGEEFPLALLILHHEKDECRVSDLEEAKSFFETVKAKTKKMVIISGGGRTGRECGPFHHHGFEGVEEKVIAVIVKWLNDN
jgi:hypothetical protein